MTDRNETAALKELGDALVEIEQTSPHATDGKWLERLTADCAPLIAEWGCPQGVDLGELARRRITPIAALTWSPSGPTAGS